MILTDESWFKKLVNIGFSSDDIIHIIDVVNDQDWINSVSSCNNKFDYAVCLANKFYVKTLCSRDYLQNVVHTSLGCMAGMPLADIVYALVFPEF